VAPLKTAGLDRRWGPPRILFIGIILTTHVHLASRLRMSGGLPVLPLYAVMAWTGGALPFLKVFTASRLGH
jgi:hypothetical protein